AARASAPAAPAGPRKTYALLVGVSKYTSKDIRPLNFAHEDALLFEKYLKSERGGGVPESNLVLLINEQATTSAIRNSFETLKARATRNDNVLMLFATHGTVVTGKQSGAYIVSFDSDPENLADTAVSMKEVQKLIQEDLGGAGQVLAFVDVCHAGTIGTIPLSNNKRINSIVDRLAETEGEAELFLFLASRPNETSEEGPQYGGGHGAFSFFLMEALNGPGDIDRNGDVTIDELIEYTQTKVFEATFERQRPREAGKYTGSRSLANTKQSGIAMLKYTPVPPGGTRGSGTLALTATEASDTRSLTRPPIPRVRISSALKEAVDFEEALNAGRILAGSERNALTGLRQLRGKVPVEELQAQKTRLQVTLEDRGQQVVLRYLTGEQTPQSRNDFITGAAYFATARQITPESLFLEARETFCLGRASLFDKDYMRGQDLLERAIRLDPEGAYTYNALGIAYLEQAIYDRAAQAFREATRRAPYWAYPRHNLSLTLTQIGDYQGAIRGYQEAMRLAPSYSYLPYNLGLVYQRINRRREAGAAFRKAIELNPNDGMPYNALGYLNASTGRTADAERYYKQALEKDANLTVARHNLGALYAERMRKPVEAVEVWRQILAKTPGYLPSRLSLAKTLASMNRTAEAIAEYDVVVKARPEYAAARLAQAELQIKSGARDAALGNLREVARQQPGNAQVWEQIGDVEKAAGRAAGSAEAYKKAMELAVEGSARKRIQRKMR
ncbi:MAG: tetratricopeptide repeat protein, partial [Bryobacteraceae bacterium]